MKWAKDGIAGLVMVEEEKIRMALDMMGKGYDFRAYDGHVIGGARCAKTPEAARSRGWEDMAVFIEMYRGFGGKS